MEVELEEYVEDNSFLMEGLNYPCLFIEGITSEEEVFFFKNRKIDSDMKLPLYCKVDGVPIAVGEFELTLDALLMLRSIFDYKLYLYKSVGVVTEIDLNDTKTLLKFIRL